ncbi:MAG: hypothetical protein RL536_212 [Candidatus Parcubacteria bacterium]|jgi:cell shape-determining protein MreC
MTYLQANRRSYQRSKQAITVTIVIVVLIIGALQLFVPHFFSSLFSSITRPFWRTEFSIESGALQSPEVLLNENESLKQQLIDAQVRLDTIRATELENVELKSLLGRDLSIPEITTFGTSTSVVAPSSTAHKKNVSKKLEQFTLSAVLKRPPFSPYDGLIIDVGTDNGISSSSLVYASGDVLIGKVVDALAVTSKVKLFSSPGEKFEVLIGPQHLPATAIGRGGGQYEAQVSREVSVNEGDFVINSSPSNKPFGVVNAVLQDPAQTFITVLIAPPVNIYGLRWVLVK